MRNARLVLMLGLCALCCCALLLCEGAVVSPKPNSSKSDEKVESIAETEKKLKRIVGSGFKIALPYMMSAVTKLRLSRGCLHSLVTLLKGVMDIKDWAIKMVDALGKPSAGILEGTATAMGDYDECLNIAVPKRLRPPPVPPYKKNETAFNGRYCVVQVHLPEGIKQAAMAYQTGNRTHSDLANTKTFLRNFIKLAPRADVIDNLRLGACIPSVCNKDDLQQIIDEVLKSIHIRATAMRCEVKEDTERIETEQIIILSLMGFFGCVFLVGTLTDIVYRISNTEPIDDVFMQKKNQWIRALLNFSLPRNTRRFLDLVPDNNDGKISCLRGMKFLSICLYILVWTYASPQDFHFYKYRSAFYFFNFMEEWWFALFANGSVGIDSLFLIAGLQISYEMWTRRNNGVVEINCLKFIIKWFLRFTLANALLIGLFLLLPMMGSGPIWADVVSPVIANCKERWWMNLIGINNFFSSDYTCLPHTWLVCCMLHLVLISPILLFILNKSASIGVFVNVAIIAGSSVAIAMVTLVEDLPPAPSFYFMSFINIHSIWHKVFIQAYDHIAPFCIGILLGFVLSRHHKIKLNKLSVVLCWSTSVVCILSILCGLYGYRHGEQMTAALSATYAAVHRIVWAMAMGWIIFACAYGYGGFVNTILSCKSLIMCDNLAVFTYMLHPLVMYLHDGQLRERKYMGHLEQVMNATAYIVFTLILSALCYITCAIPYLYFERKACREFPTSPSIEESSNKLKEHVRSSTEQKIKDIVLRKKKFQQSRPPSTIAIISET